MSRYCWVLLVLVSMNSFSQIKKFETDHFLVKYEAEAETYARASVKILEYTRELAIQYGFDLPHKLQFSVLRSDRNVLYFDYKKLKGITWEYNSMTNFLPPEESRKKNVYGLCHEIGHLCMYRSVPVKNNWMSGDFRESWADFFGNYIIDTVYEHLGAACWPEPHDYKETAGMVFLLSRIAKDDPEWMSFNRASQYWYEMHTRLGFQGFTRFFQELHKQKVRNPNAGEEYLEVLSMFIPEDDLHEWFEPYAEYLIVHTP